MIKVGFDYYFEILINVEKKKKELREELGFFYFLLNVMV